MSVALPVFCLDAYLAPASAAHEQRLQQVELVYSVVGEPVGTHKMALMLHCCARGIFHCTWLDRFVLGALYLSLEVQQLCEHLQACLGSPASCRAGAAWQ
jgi:hypothetical protein